MYDTIATEEAVYTKENKYPVYIILQHSGTPMSNVIKKFTGDEFSHACISFNSKLNPHYSFGNKKVDVMVTGFTVQKITDKFYKTKKVKYSVYVMYVNKKQYTQMIEKIEWFKKNNFNLKYSAFDCVKCFFGIPSDNNEKFFCSGFVATILNAGHGTDKAPSLYKPQDLTGFQDITLVNKGDDLSKYDYRITERNLKKIQKGTYDEIAFEAYMIDNYGIVNEGFTQRIWQGVLSMINTFKRWIQRICLQLQNHNCNIKVPKPLSAISCDIYSSMKNMFNSINTLDILPLKSKDYDKSLNSYEEALKQLESDDYSDAMYISQSKKKFISELLDVNKKLTIQEKMVYKLIGKSQTESDEYYKANLLKRCCNVWMRALFLNIKFGQKEKDGQVTPLNKEIDCKLMDDQAVMV